ncbi:hypothetical protein DPMN_103795 [Dreissena polymorpha]|uniref:Uncharacterized protein n=1 Tax=Dreissena polymorpha TaxID=45954 RepID=A0A9D4HAE7_DREPO|nr:hypothetical protein DPMN_103795 [Dreissena polymorpha]
MTGMNRGQLGLSQESIKTGMNWESLGRTGNDRRGTGNNWDGTGNNRDGTQSYGNAPENAVRVLKTGASPEHHQHSPGLRWGITSEDRALPGSDVGMDTVSANGVTVYRGSASFYCGSTGALPTTTGAMPGRCLFSPGHYRRQPGLCLDKT